jgi:hypothetical protein
MALSNCIYIHTVCICFLQLKKTIEVDDGKIIPMQCCSANLLSDLDLGLEKKLKKKIKTRTRKITIRR